MELNKENYYSLEANRHYMSVSQFKNFLPAYDGCEAAAMAELKGEYTKEPIEAFTEGHFLHSWNEGVLHEWKASNPQIYAKTGKTAGQLKANFKHCEKMIEVLENDPFVMDVLSGQKEVIFTAELFGIPWKVMFDSYNPDAAGIFADLKSMKEMDGKFWNKDAQAYENFIDHYGYNVQMAVYAEIEKRATKRDLWLIPNMVVVTKQEPPDHDIIYFDYDAIEAGLQIVARNIERVKAVKAGKVEPIRCEKCEYCRLTKKINRIKHVSELSLY
ncbi:PD-(D/E)XK nuclease-like domain-containing protein [Paenibacillus macerans]|uniref:PD-(D/E)XK nuclease-like domain-containing protein n=1 Tax=Paenibacillus macerans TaxID=44252 RepID=UPI002042189A|nr:PD-(D/E)XK nuclease-like domain-containing protein [Paenibacillus macerans]MCM3701873.1 PD-(D/E)XK nuclease-like domain-containing protein [Paenibacillus macerans]